MAIQTTCEVGKTVGVIRNLNYGSRNPQGLYTVTKVNKMVVTLARVGDNYERSWSVKTGVEKDGFSTRYNTADIVSAEDYDKLVAAVEARKAMNQLWREMDTAVAREDIPAIEATLAKIKAAKA